MTSSSIMPSPPATRRSIKRIGHGFKISNSRNSKNAGIPPPVERCREQYEPLRGDLVDDDNARVVQATRRRNPRACPYPDRKSDNRRGGECEPAASRDDFPAAEEGKERSPAARHPRQMPDPEP